MLELSAGKEHATPQARLATKQVFRLQIALVLLLVTLAALLVKDRDFWFGSEEAVESDAAASQNAVKASSVAPAKTGVASVSKVAGVKTHRASKTSTESAVAASSSSDASSTAPPTVVTRTVIPPMDVEVVAGDTHRTLYAGSNVQIPSDSNHASEVNASVANLPTNAAERELVSPNVSEVHQTQTIDASYPLLGQHMRVQGSVVLQAVVGADGIIENLRVLSGPAVLTTAAQQAVREWHFKPYLQNGQPVETKARITVNFSIRISDPNAKTS
ncbi:MAG: energy transducer TonB [Candidatus Sulfotelmatobacter sp.]